MIKPYHSLLPLTLMSGLLFVTAVPSAYAGFRWNGSSMDGQTEPEQNTTAGLRFNGSSVDGSNNQKQEPVYQVAAAPGNQSRGSGGRTGGDWIINGSSLEGHSAASGSN